MASISSCIGRCSRGTVMLHKRSLVMLAITGLVSQVAADGHGNLTRGQVAGIIIGSVGGSLLLLVCCCCFWRRRRRTSAFGSKSDLESPFDLHRHGGSGRAGKGTGDLEVSPNMVVDYNIGLDLSGAEGVVEMQRVGPGKGVPTNSSTLQDTHSGKVSEPLSKAASIMRWLEGSDSGKATHATTEVGEDSASVLAGCLPISINASAGPTAADPMKKRLLHAGGAGYGGDSAKHPLDIKGIVFNKLPASVSGSPAPSTIDTTLSRARITRATHDMAVPEMADLLGDLGAPEQQGLAAAAASLVRIDSFGSQASFRPGLAFASIGSDSLRSSQPSLGRTSMTRGLSRMSRSAVEAYAAAAVAGGQQPSQQQQASGQQVLAVQDGTHMSYSQAVAVLRHAAGAPPTGHQLPVGMPAGAGGVVGQHNTQPLQRTSSGGAQGPGAPFAHRYHEVAMGGGARGPMVGVLVADTLPALAEETTTDYSSTMGSSMPSSVVPSPMGTGTHASFNHRASGSGRVSNSGPQPQAVPHRLSSSGPAPPPLFMPTTPGKPPGAGATSPAITSPGFRAVTLSSLSPDAHGAKKSGAPVPGTGRSTQERDGNVLALPMPPSQ